MAEYKSETATAQDNAGSNAANMISTAELISGKIQFLQCEVIIPAGTATSDTIVLGYVPAGSTVIPGLITIQTKVVCGAFENSIGTAAAPESITNSITLNTVGVQHLGSVISAGSIKYDERTALILTLADSALTEGGTFYVNIPLVNSN